MQKKRNTDQWKRIESPDINPCTHSHLIYNKQNKNIQQRKNSPLVRGAGKTGQLYVNQRNENTP